MKTTHILRNILAREESILVPGAYDALSAKILKQAGFEVIYMTGSGVTASLTGWPDVGILSMAEMVNQARNIVNATNLPLICDADNGYGNAINVLRTVKEFERAGAAGIHIEDQVFPKRCGHFEGKQVIPAEEMGFKIVLYPTSGIRAVAKTLQELATHLKKYKDTRQFEERLVTFEGRNRITGLAQIKEMEKKFLRVKKEVP